MSSSRVKRSLKTIFAAAGVMFMGMVADQGLNYLSKIAIARYLGAENFGLVTLGNTMLTFVSVFVILGLDTGISRFLPRYDEKERTRGVLVSGFYIGIALAIITATVLVVFAGVIANVFLRIPESKNILRIFGLTVPVFVTFKLTMGGIRGTERALPRVYAQHIGMPFVRLSLFVLFILGGASVFAFAVSYSIAYAFGAIVGLYYLWKHTTIFDFSLNYAPMYRELLMFSTPLIISSIMYRILSYADIFLLSYFTTSAATVGIYSVIYSLSRLMLIILSAFGYITLPVLSRMESNDTGGRRDMIEVYRTLTKWVFIVSFPLFMTLLLFPTTVIKYSFGSDYVGGAVALQILGAGFFSHAIVGPNGNVLQSVGKTRILMIDNVAIAVLNLALNVLLIPPLGLIGASMATAVCYFLLNVIYSYQLYGATKIQPISKPMLIVGSISTPIFLLVTGGIRTAIMNVGFQLFITLFIFSIIYFFIVVLVAVNEQELSIIDSAAKKYPHLKPISSLIAKLSRL